MTRFLIGMIMSASLFPLLSNTGYEESIQAWQKHRNDGLRKPDSWLTLVGLYWLSPGGNTIGSGSSSNFVLPKNDAPEKVGTLRLNGDRITYLPADGAKPSQLSYDDDHPDVIHAGTISFFVIKRGDRFAVRAKDSESPVLKNFKGVTFFPINPAMHFNARLIPDVKKIPVPNILGKVEYSESPGFVEFAYQGTKYRLRPIYEGKTLFFIFADPTNKETTYQAGRMLNTPLPIDGKVDLDFNRAYNPPCTFTPFATCPLPPKENHLPFPVNAGERRYGKGHAEFPAT